MLKKVLSKEELSNINKYWMATNYLSVAQLYLVDNVLLDRNLKMSDVKKKIIGHWGSAPGQNFIYTHLNRVIKKNNLNMIYVSGPGHSGQAMIANSYLEEVYCEYYPEVTLDKDGIKNLCKRFSFPGGVSSHVSPEVPGSINEGGELGYSLLHSFGAVFDNPNLIAACVVGDGEAETGALATSWNMIKFLNPKRDGMVLPIIHLNGYKIGSPTVLGRMTDLELRNYFSSFGYKVYIVSGKQPKYMHQMMAGVMDDAINDINKIKKGFDVKFPLIILKSPKGWGCPKVIDGKDIEGSFRSHQVPIQINDLEDLKLLEKWLKNYHPELLFDKNGKLFSDIKKTLPSFGKRMSNNPIVNEVCLYKDLKIPDFKKYMVNKGIVSEDMRNLGKFVRDIMKQNNNFRVFGPDEAMSNRLNSVFDVTDRTWCDNIYDSDEFLSCDGRVMDSYLSEHVCEGLLEGYILTGRHGFFHSYEAFVRIIDSMVSQHAKWLKVCNEIAWRDEIPSLNYVLTSHTWQQDHNGFTHQDPGFMNHLVTKKSDTIRMYLPIDTNTLISCFDHVIKSKNYINVIIASKHPSYQWLDKKEAIDICTKGIGVLDFVSSDGEPDLVFGCAGDTPTVEVIEAAKILKEFCPSLKVRVVCTIDLMKLQSNRKHPHGLSNNAYDKLFTVDKPIIFNFHGYPSLIHELTYDRTNQDLHVHGYNEEGTITTAFDMRVLNKIDRFHLVLDAVKYVNLKNEDEVVNYCKEKLSYHKKYIKKNGVDMPGIKDF